MTTLPHTSGVLLPAFRPLLAILCAFFAAVADATAQSAPTGTIEGRVLNATSETVLTNARVTIPGTRLEAFTNELGEFRLAHVPAGETQLEVAFTGLTPQRISLAVPPGAIVRRDFELTRGAATSDPSVVRLNQFVVATNREMNAADIALNEQRHAANIKNVVDADAFGDAGEGNLGDSSSSFPASR